MRAKIGTTMKNVVVALAGTYAAVLTYKLSGDQVACGTAGGLTVCVCALINWRE